MLKVDDSQEQAVRLAEESKKAYEKRGVKVEEFEKDFGEHKNIAMTRLSNLRFLYCADDVKQGYEAGALHRNNYLRKMLSWVTCAGCSQTETCPFAWDQYNTSGDCLAEK